MSYKPPKKQSSAPPAKNRLIGSVRALRDGLGYVEIQDSENLSLSKQDMRRVFPGDLVEVRASREGRDGRPKGRIIDVLERNTSELVGRFDIEHNLAYVRPSNRRIAHDIHVPKKASLNAQPGQIVVVEITEQPGDFAPAYGQVTDILGDELSAGMEIQVALHNFNIPHEWPEVVEDEADKLGSSVKTAHKKHRLDLRKKPFVTIDGEDARDFDDAVYAEACKDGWKLWVAIADVSHYVKPGSALDMEAENRGTSVYFPDYVVPMLPEVLSNGLCSLKPRVDRLAMVCEMEIDAAGSITDFHFADALIHSHERLTYTRVAKVLEEKNQKQQEERAKLGALCEHIDQLHALYKVLMSARQKRGAMEFETAEVRFEFDENRKIDSIVPLHRNDAHKLIEECMLCANICAAEFLSSNEIPGLYRVHLPPANEKLAALRDYLAELGLWLGGGDEPKPADFAPLVEVIGDRPDRSIIQTMILRSQQQAVYQPENKGHFGLAYKAYAHFTSPIRRYPDLMVHRAIRSVIRSDRNASHVRRVEAAPSQKASRLYPYDLEAIQALGQSCSMTERRAEEASRDVIQWLKCEYLQKHVGDQFMGVVAAVTHFGLFVELADLYVEGLVHITNLPKDYYEYDSISHILTGQTTRRTFKMGDKAIVQVAKVDLDERKIDLELANRSEDPGDTGGDEPRGRRYDRNRSCQNPLEKQKRSDEKRIKKKSLRRPSAKKSGTRRSSGKKHSRRRK